MCAQLKEVRYSTKDYKMRTTLRIRAHAPNRETDICFLSPKRTVIHYIFPFCEFPYIEPQGLQTFPIPAERLLESCEHLLHMQARH